MGKKRKVIFSILAIFIIIGFIVGGVIIKKRLAEKSKVIEAEQEYQREIEKYQEILSYMDYFT